MEKQSLTAAILFRLYDNRSSKWNFSFAPFIFTQNKTVVFDDSYRWWFINLSTKLIALFWMNVLCKNYFDLIQIITHKWTKKNGDCVVWQVHIWHIRICGELDDVIFVARRMFVFVSYWWNLAHFFLSFVVLNCEQNVLNLICRSFVCDKY